LKRKKDQNDLASSSSSSNKQDNTITRTVKRSKRNIINSDSEQEEEEDRQQKQQQQKQEKQYLKEYKKPIMSGFTRRRTTSNGIDGNGSTLQKRSFKIKPFSLSIVPTLPPNFEADTWNMLHAAVNAIQKNEAIHISQEELYKAVNNMCLHKYEKFLFVNLEKVCRENVQQRIFANELKPCVEKYATDADYYSFLSKVSNVWNNYRNQMATIASIFLYLDRTFIITNYSSNTPIEGIGLYRSIEDMGLQQFCSELLNMRNADILEKIVSGVLHMIQSEREGNDVDRAVLRNVLQMLWLLRIYREHFENRFIKQTEEFYSLESSKLVLESNIPEYLVYVQNRLAQEKDRAQSYLIGTRRLLISCVECECIQKHVDLIIERGFEELMEQHRIEDLSRMYNLIAQANELEKLKQAFVNYIKKKGDNIIRVLDDTQGTSSHDFVVVQEDSANIKGIEMVEEILKFKAKIDEIMRLCFKSNESFNYGMKAGFEYFINSRHNQPAEYIAKFIDQKLRSGGKNLTDEELEAVMDDTMVLFRYISGKDVFEAFYKKDFAKRLLLDRSASIEAEKSMISRLRTESGKQFTGKLEGMFRDIDISRDLMTQFLSSPMYEEWKHAHEDMKNIEPNITVITSGFWPSYPEINVRLPSYVEPIQDIYKQFYLEKHSGRVLKWQNTLGQCTLRAHFPLGTKELLVSIFQASILFLYNNENIDSLTYAEIKAQCGIDDNGELNRTLQSLSIGKTKVLTKTAASREASLKEMTFHYNKDFQHSLYRIRINSIQIRETKKEHYETQEKILLERQYAIDAAIVRIMKARKQLSHQQLIAETFKQLKFPIKTVDIKKRIETLIEREYIERINMERPDQQSSSEEGITATTGYKYLA
jgi:cullin-4